jgi:apolipoprotein N-acyltransferase
MAPPFVETQLTVNVPIMKQKTFYTKHGDFLAYIFILFSLGALILGGILWIFKRKKL